MLTLFLQDSPEDTCYRLANRNDQRIAAMSITRNNHYVPQWYQEGFFEPGRSSLAYVDLTPDRKELPDGRVIIQRGSWDDMPTSKAFRQKDLYSTFFGTSVNDEIERHLFGDIDIEPKCVVQLKGVLPGDGVIASFARPNRCLLEKTDASI